ncbi:unnamed protein product [Lactuca saligna]|uniref:Protein kinase domain-containing protein n=1 Tax=Lactuca saligna TaxID=75948 RepID=A0AA36E5I6_LACSI|nr:unnamed protein product [Lactuca saligna]
MLVGGYPFEDPNEPKDFRKTIHRILHVQYSIPENIQLSPECWHLISRIFVGDPTQRITMAEIKQHKWFLKNLPENLMDEDKMMTNHFEEPDQPMQSVDVIMQIISEATIPPVGLYDLDMMDDDLDDFDSDPDELDIDSSALIFSLSGNAVSHLTFPDQSRQRKYTPVAGAPTSSTLFPNRRHHPSKFQSC